jgi:HSP20 family molecular chaperone IbpA
MIIAFAPDQLQEVAQAFDVPWWMSDEMNKEATSSQDQDKKAPPAASKDTEDSKPAAKTPCRPNNGCNWGYRRKNWGGCRPGYRSTFSPCRQYQQNARCRRQEYNQQNPSARRVEQRTPIHMPEETPTAARMSLDVTGFDPQEISISIENHIVSIKGQRTNRLGDVFVLDRKFRLDKATASVDGVTATFQEGILELTVPKKTVAGPRKIPIVVAASASAPLDEDQAMEEDSKPEAIATPTQAVVHPSSSEGTSSTEQNEAETMAVETVTAEETNGEARVEMVEVPATAPTEDAVEDETWEEVTK